MNKYEVFISYRRKGGQDLADFLMPGLRSNAINTFFDNEELHIGDFREQLVENNKNAKYLVVLLSPGSLDRCKNEGDWVRHEISLFLEEQKTVIPIKFKNFEFPDDLPPELNALKRLRCIEYNEIICDEHSPDAYESKRRKQELLDNIVQRIRTGWTEEEKRESIREIEEIKPPMGLEEGEYSRFEEYIAQYRSVCFQKLPVSFIVTLFLLALASGVIYGLLNIELNGDVFIGISLFAALSTAMLHAKRKGRLEVLAKTLSPAGIFAVLKSLVFGIATVIAPMAVISVIYVQLEDSFKGYEQTAETLLTFILIFWFMLLFWIPLIMLILDTIPVYRHLFNSFGGYFGTVFKQRKLIEKSEAPKKRTWKIFLCVLILGIFSALIVFNA